MDADVVAALLHLTPLPAEGGRFRRTYADDHSSAIYYLLRPGDFSALHALAGVEVYHFYAGAPVRLLLLDEASGSAREVLLGNDLAAGEVPQLVVPAGVWQGSATIGDWSLLGTTMAPPYTDSGFRLGGRDELIARFPGAAGEIARLTR